jgi:hypothetical protein
MRTKTFLLLVILIGVLVKIPFFHYTVDDTYINLVFARNLATGKGMSFNPNQPSGAMTSPLLAFTTALAYLVTRELFYTSKLLEVFFSILSIPLVYFVSQKLFKEKTISIVATVLWAINPWFVLWSVTGMDTSLFTFLSLFGVYFLIDENKKSIFIGSFLIGLSTLARPEGGFIFLLLLFRNFVFWLKKRTDFRSIVLPLIAFSIPVAPWLLYSYFSFGNIVPNSYASIMSFLKFSIQGAFGASSSGLLFLVGSFILQIPFVIIGLLLVLKEGDFLKNHFIPIFWTILVLGFYLVSGLVFIRYFIPTFPFIIIYSIYGLVEVCKSLKGIGKMAFITMIVLILLRDTAIGIFAFNFSIKYQKGLEESYIYMANWLKSNSPKDATVAAHDFGALGFISERKIIDITGLVDREAFPYRENLSSFLEMKKPDYLIIIDEWYKPTLDSFISNHCNFNFSKSCQDCLFPSGNFTFSVYSCK